MANQPDPKEPGATSKEDPEVEVEGGMDKEEGEMMLFKAGFNAAINACSVKSNDEESSPLCC